MHRILHGLALAALLFTACGGYLYYGYGWCDPYYGGYCYDYVYVAWRPDALAATDFDEDGQLDLAVADGRAGTVWFLRGASGGGFAPVPSAPLAAPVAPDALALANLDGDADPDLLVLDGSPGGGRRVRGGRSRRVHPAVPAAGAPCLHPGRHAVRARAARRRCLRRPCHRRLARRAARGAGNWGRYVHRRGPG